MDDRPAGEVGNAGLGPLVPLDEAYLAHAEVLREVAASAREALPLEPRLRHEPGGELRTALRLAEVVARLTDRAVVVAVERGVSWADVAAIAGVDEDDARRRWADVAREWTTAGGRRRPPDRGDSVTVARDLDAWYRSVDSQVRDAVTAGLASASESGAAVREEADRRRAEAAALYRTSPGEAWRPGPRGPAA
ncbi:hypothetical protein [Embleya sp. NPDC020886]|uniref:hypothetical protein n=1 Tax=Embleya sp. NPDC020886 TaxID=3363980 RepID=UPI0037A7FC20